MEKGKDEEEEEEKEEYKKVKGEEERIGKDQEQSIPCKGVSSN